MGWKTWKLYGVERWMKGWNWPKKGQLEKGERRKQRKDRGRNQRKTKRKLRAQRSQRRNRERGYTDEVLEV